MEMQKSSNPWFSWTAWSMCSTSCGIGISVRTRDCKTSACIGDVIQKKNCMLRKCPQTSKLKIKNYFSVILIYHKKRSFFKMYF